MQLWTYLIIKSDLCWPFLTTDHFGDSNLESPEHESPHQTTGQLSSTFGEVTSFACTGYLLIGIGPTLRFIGTQRD